MAKGSKPVGKMSVTDPGMVGEGMGGLNQIKPLSRACLSPDPSKSTSLKSQHFTVLCKYYAQSSLDLS